MTDYKTCTHLYDDGNRCGSAALTNRDYCSYHLRYRGRLMRRAQYRARHQRYDMKLPPSNPCPSVALSEIVEALAADMIDLARPSLLKSLRFAAQALKSSDKWQPSVFHSDVAAPAVDLATEYGLPEDLDLNVGQRWLSRPLLHPKRTTGNRQLTTFAGAPYKPMLLVRGFSRTAPTPTTFTTLPSFP